MQTESGAGGGPVLRRIAAAILVVATALLAIVTLLGGYVRSELLTTDRYVAIVGPLARDPAIRAEVVEATTAAIVDNVRVDELTRDALELLRAGDTRLAALLTSDRRLAQALNGVLAGVGPLLQNQLAEATRRAAERVVESDQFAELWAEGNRRAHGAALVALRDQGSLLRTGDGEIAVDLSVIIDRVRQRLIDSGLSIAARIPVLDRQLVLVSSPELAKAQVALRLVDQVGPWLPWATLALAAAAIAVANDRRRAVVWSGLGLVLAMSVCGFALVAARQLFLERVASTSVGPEAAAAAVDAVLDPLWWRLWSVVIGSALLALVAWLIGPTGARIARWARHRMGFRPAP